MGRQTTLVYMQNYFKLKNENNLGNNIIGWRPVVLEDGEVAEIVPYVDNWENLPTYSGGFKDLMWNKIETNSSQLYISKFKGYYMENFPFIHENIVENLAEYLKEIFDNGSAVLIINDNMSGGILNYIIRFQLKNNKVKFVFEIMDVDSDNNFFDTIRIELKF